MRDQLKITVGMLVLAVLVTGWAQAAERTWTGTVDDDWFESGNWSPDDNYPQADDTVIIPSGKTVLLTNETAELAAFSITNATLTFSNWTTRLRASEVKIENGGVFTLPAAFPDAGPSNRVWIACNNFTLNPGGQINVDGRGYASQNGQGKGANANHNSSGGGYGGRGGNGSTTVGGSAYGSINAPLDPGSGGGYDTWTTAQNGQGGGAVRIEAGGTVMIDGTISANGTRVSGSAGSGGAIYISSMTFGGGTGGLLRANGGTAAGNYGGGGGGRIAVTYSDVSGTVGVRFGVAGGAGYISDKTLPTSAQMGTLYLSDTNALSDVWKNQVQGAHLYIPGFTSWTGNDMVVSNAFVGLPDSFALNASNILMATDAGVFLGADSVVSCSNLTIQAGAMLTMNTNAVLTCGQTMSLLGSGASVVFQANAVLTCGGDILLNQGQLNLGIAPALNCAGNMTLTNSASLSVYSGPTNGLSVSYGARVGVTNTLTVAPNGWIYPWSDTTNGGSVLFSVGTLTILPGGGINADGRGYASQNGQGKGANGSQNAAGAGYGGKGGNGSGSTGGSPHGSTNAPLVPGSGGGYDTWTGRHGGAGGGAVRIEATNAVTIDGLITANGTNATGSAGSGGAIFIACQSFIGGAGAVMRANGGSASGNYGGGGGGRISVAIGFSSANLSNLLAGADVVGMVVNAQDPAYAGQLSVTNGTGYANGPPNGAAMGTRQFLKVQAANERFVTIDGAPGQYGSPSPNGYAAWPVENGTIFTNTVVTPANELNGMRWSCLGWRLTDTVLGDPITNEVGTQAVFTVNANVTLTWLWTNEFQLAFAPGPNGSVNSSVLNGWYTNGTSVTTLEATPDPGYYFVAWVGADVPGSPAANNPLTVLMDRARTNITATFASQAGVPMTWTGTGNWMSLANWSPPGVPGSNDTILVQGGSVTLSEAYRVGELVVNTGATLVFSNWNTCLTAGDVTVMSNGTITLPPAFPAAGPSNRVWVVCDNFTLNPGGQVNVDGKGYASQNGQGKGANANFNSSGGGYGGRGGNGSTTVGGSAYGSTNAPLAPGSGGGYDTWTAAQNGQGGGAVRIEAGGTVTIDGTISANGTRVSGSAGSGGAIYISCTTFGGGAGGLLRANGGTAAGNYGGGGGGRIAVWAGVSDAARDLYLAGMTNKVFRSTTNSYYMGTISVTNGTGYVNEPPNGAAPGTAFFFTPRPVLGTVLQFR